MFTLPLLINKFDFIDIQNRPIEPTGCWYCSVVFSLEIYVLDVSDCETILDWIKVRQLQLLAAVDEQVLWTDEPKSLLAIRISMICTGPRGRLEMGSPVLNNFVLLFCLRNRDHNLPKKIASKRSICRKEENKFKFNAPVSIGVW